MKYNFCTLFDSYYLSRGLTLYKSLEENCKNYHLYIFSFDQSSYDYLSAINLRNATIIHLNEFENERLLKVKPTRTVAEYCWTCTASIIWYSIHYYKLDHCTYIDADMLFYSSPKPIFDEIGKKSIGITLHNFSQKHKSSIILGKYCVQFVYFKNDKAGIEALNWWMNSCIEWCFAKLEDNKYGDQKYLEYLPLFFQNVCEIKHIGAGLAPWNIDKYNLWIEQNKIYLSEKNSLQKYPLIFYHFQGLKIIEKDKKVVVEATSDKTPSMVLSLLYRPYIQKIIIQKNEIIGVQDKQKKITFKNNIIKHTYVIIKRSLKNYILIQKIYFTCIKKKYNRPNKIG